MHAHTFRCVRLTKSANLRNVPLAVYTYALTFTGEVVAATPFKLSINASSWVVIGTSRSLALDQIRVLFATHLRESSTINCQQNILTTVRIGIATVGRTSLLPTEIVGHSAILEMPLADSPIR